MEPLISVIIPVYNTEKYLVNTLESVLRQTYANLEVILVDDGSTDKSGALCDVYAEQDHRIVVHHQDNQGVSAARNWALDHVHGDYILFVDSDDIVSPDLAAVCLKAAVDTQADIVVFRIKKVFCEISLNDLPFQEEVLIDYNESAESIRKRVLLNKISNYLPTGLYRSYLWKDVRFPDYTSHEDLYSMPEVFIKAKSMICLDNILYYYNQMNLSSISKGNGIWDVRKRYDKFRAYERHRFWGNQLNDNEVVDWAVFHMMHDAIKISYVHFYSSTKLTTDEMNHIMQFMKTEWTIKISRCIGKKAALLRWGAMHFPYSCKIYGFIRYKQELFKRWIKNDCKV